MISMKSKSCKELIDNFKSIGIDVLLFVRTLLNSFFQVALPIDVFSLLLIIRLYQE